MKKLILAITSCAILSLTIASCATTKGSVPAQSAVTGTSTLDADSGLKK